ncbi:MAG: hypothetical protein AAFO04_10690 [Cyanobacteria bacterium J06592_8]
MNSNSLCKSGQIVKLEHNQYCLYAEVIQVVTTRQMYWVRPLMLLEFSSEPALRDDPQSHKFYNLRDSSDLIWPFNLFQPALDTEVIPLLVELDSTHEKNSNTKAIAHQQLRSFVHKVWQADPDSFPR